jgi:hypothetical protein
MLLLLVAGCANAQVIYKCRDAKGAMTYQNAPCPPDAKPVQAKAYDTGKPSNAALWQAYNAKKEMEARNAAMNSGSGYVYRSTPEPTERDKKKERCRLARVAWQRGISAGVPSAVGVNLSRAETDACAGL